MRIATTVLLLLLASSWAPATRAADEPAAQPKVRTERVPAMRERAYKQLARAREQADKQEFTEALALLTDLREDRRANAYEKAMAWNLTAFVSFELDRQEDAITAYQQVLAQDTIPSALRINTLYGLGQLYMSTSRWQQAARTLEQWFELNEAPGTSGYILLGSAYFQLKDYARARKPIETAIAAARERGEVPPENALLLLRAIYFGANDFAQMAEVLKTLCTHYSKREYWTQLAAVYGQMDNSKRQLAAMNYAYDAGMFDREADYLTLAQLLLGAEVPFRAAQVLSDGMAKGKVAGNLRNYRTLADAYVMAKEYPKAIAALQQAAKLSDDGELDLRLAQMHFETGDYPATVSAANQALKKGALKSPHEAHIIAGLAHYEQDRLAEARRAFQSAAGYDDARQMAGQWLGFLGKEIERETLLAELKSDGSSARLSAQ